MTTYEVTLELAGQPDRTITVEARETILEAAHRAGVRLPADCREGTCSTCAGRVLSVDGEPADHSGQDASLAVDYRRQPTAVSRDEQADGYALLCIAMPRADCRIHVGPEVRSALGDSPWA